MGVAFESFADFDVSINFSFTFEH